MRKSKSLATSLNRIPNSELPTQHLHAKNDDIASDDWHLSTALQDAISSGSSEIHFEQDKQICRVRKRLNGQLDETRIDSASLVAELIAEVHGIRAVKPNPPPITTHGELAITVEANTASYTLHCTYYSTTSGHNLSIRISCSEKIPETLEQTTLDSPQIQLLRNHFSKKSHGLTIVCGPNIDFLQNVYYGLLGETNCVENKIVSLEHHSKKEFPRINQLSLAGLDNADSISQLATQGADKIFIDWQCSKNKLIVKKVLDDYQSATVFVSALDINTAISQLTDYALNERQLATNLSTLIQLDTVRIVCPHCANSHDLNGADMQWLEGQELNSKIKADSAFVYAPGCERCEYSGSQESVPLMSVCTVDDNIRSAIETRISSDINKAIQQRSGKNTLQGQVSVLVSKGMVSFTEYKTR